MRFLSASIASSALLAIIAPVALAAPPSQLVLDSHREPDFVDVLEAEAKAQGAASQAATKASAAFWPPVPTPTPGGGWVWSTCGEESDAVEVKDIRVSPDPPQAGKNLTVHALGVVKRTIDVSIDSRAPLWYIADEAWRVRLYLDRI